MNIETIIKENINLFHKIVNKYYNKSLLMDKEDVLQEILTNFAYYYKDFENFNSSLSTFIWTISKNRILSLIQEQNAIKRKSDIANDYDFNLVEDETIISDYDNYIYNELFEMDYGEYTILILNNVKKKDICNNYGISYNTLMKYHNSNIEYLKEKYKEL